MLLVKRSLILTPVILVMAVAAVLTVDVAKPGLSPAAPGPGSPDPTTRDYPLHTNIVATTFWVGEIFNPKVADGSQVCSTYDSQWAYRWSGVSRGRVPARAKGCPGSRLGGCDGISKRHRVKKRGKKRWRWTCRTERRTADNGFFPTRGPKPRENPFYLDLPYDDLNDRIGFARRCELIPWAGRGRFYSGRCRDRSFSFMKNRWVGITGPNGRTCYGQIEDAGPSHGRLYHDAAYVFGERDRRPRQRKFNNAGMDVSPALNGCLGFAELNGKRDRVDWRFIDNRAVPNGPWRRVVTRSGVRN